MANGRNRLYFGVSFLFSSLPALAGIYCMALQLWPLVVPLIALSIVCMGLSTMFFVSYKTIKHGTPFVYGILEMVSRVLGPVTRMISGTRVVGPVVSSFIRFNFFLWFMMLLFSDHLLRAVLRRVVGRHPTKRNFSVINAMDPKFDLFDSSIPPTKHLQDSDLFRIRKHLAADKLGGDKGWINHIHRPKYSRSLAYTLAVASKLVYEDQAVVRYELERAGFDVKHTFRAMAYLNICAFIVEKDNDILLVFRGTNPLNIQNYITNINAGLGDIRGQQGSMGRVHRGYWDAMGGPSPAQGESGATTATASTSSMRIELNNTSLYRTIVSAGQAVLKIVQFLMLNLFHHVSDPVDTSWTGHDYDIRSASMYAQAEKYILELIRKPSPPSAPKRRLFITGHSLGGALGTIFLAKMLQCNSPVLENFAGLYTYGQPKIGDAKFATIFGPKMSAKIFHHAYNNDITPRIPFLQYDTPPGTLVFIDSAYNITLYPPNPYTNVPVPVRRISFIHLSGLLNLHVIFRLANENWIRIFFRVIFPFFLNDHFPSDYCDSLRRGTVKWVIMGTDGLEGGLEINGSETTTSTSSPPKSLRPDKTQLSHRRPSIINVQDQTMTEMSTLDER